MTLVPSDNAIRPVPRFEEYTNGDADAVEASDQISSAVTPPVEVVKVKRKKKTKKPTALA